MNTRIRRKTVTALACLLLSGTIAADENDLRDEQAEHADLARERTEEAINEAVEEALLSLEKDNRLDLDIRLIGPRSISIAARQ